MRTTIIKPLITEQSMKDAKTGKFTFQVDPDASKPQIRSEVEKLFNVTVKGVATVSIRRSKTIFTKFGRKKTKATIKKARVRLAKGQKIAAFDLPEEKKVKKEKEANDKKA